MVNEGINGFYPVEDCTTTAQQTLNIIREILHKNNSSDIILNNFFNAERREVTSENKRLFDKFDINDQLEKLKFILSNKKLAIPLLKEAYLDFYLFIDLLDKIDIVPTEEVELNKIPNQYDNASSNTKILKIANSFSKLR